MKSFAATALAVSLIGISGCAQAGQSSGHDMKKADVEQIIQGYLMANPEILRAVSYTHLTLPTIYSV